MKRQTASSTAVSLEPPLFVDLDGTLIKTDLLFESFLLSIKRNPFSLFRWLICLVRGKAHLKSELAKQVNIAPHRLPYQTQLLDFLMAEAVKGRPVYLATASDRKYADEIARHLDGIFCGVLASDGSTNLKGGEKLSAILRLCKDSPFDYAGNSAADLPIWRRARNAVLVNPSRPLVLNRRVPNVSRVFEDRTNRSHALLKMIRPHQWLKNLLLFVPLLTGHVWSIAALGVTFCGFLAFSLIASGTYVLNDMFDVDSDRTHPDKCTRPFAAGTVSPVAGLFLSGMLLSVGFTLGYLLGLPFALVLLGYLCVTIAYSIQLKQYVLIDILVLAGLYTIRLFAGAVPVRIELSFWLVAFSIFVFFSLALVKRCAELKTLGQIGIRSTSGRDYQSTDLPILMAMGIASGYAAVLVLALFINSPDVAQRYAHPQVLWLVCPLLFYWISRLWIKTGRDEMRDDPIIFTVMDRGSRYIVGAIILAVIVALHR
jgi:4-hydroxybenzoate polyprenyltransferase/phosphoserine phosphatase